MIVSFIRHGESISNTQGVFSGGVDHKNGLTETGEKQIRDAAKKLHGVITGIYTSPFLRSVESANIFISNRPEKLITVVDDRLREIDYGVHNNKKSSPEMAEVSKRQIAGDYEVRFGKTGENKREILLRFYCFLIQAISDHGSTDHIVVFSHGRAISIIEGEINNLKGDNPEHTSTSNSEIKQIVLSSKDKLLFHTAVNRLQKG